MSCEPSFEYRSCRTRREHAKYDIVAIKKRYFGVRLPSASFTFLPEAIWGGNVNPRLAEEKQAGGVW
jgi:hypothetical protein